MKILLPVAAAGLATLGWPADDPPTASERYDALLASVSSAAALEYSFEGELAFTFEGDTAVQMGQSGGRAELSGEARLAWPNAGRSLFTYRSIIEPDGEEDAPEVEPIRAEYIGDGERVYRLESESKVAIADGHSWAFMAVDTPLMMGFLKREKGAFESVTEVAEDGRPGQVGLHATYSEGRTETVWLSEGGSVLEVQSSIDGGGLLVDIHVRFSTWRVLAEADPATYVTDLPEGYEVEEYEESAGATDFEASLLALGATAPDVTLIGMDDAEFQLSSLKGKTVLLNFWFYH